MTYRYSTALSHLLLASTSIYCLSKYHRDDEIDMPCVSFATLIVYSALGIWRWGNPDYGYKIDKIYVFARRVQICLSLSCIVGQLAINAGCDDAVAIAFPVISGIPILTYLLGNTIAQDVIDLIITLNIIGCITFSYMRDNFWGMTTAVSYTIAHYGRSDNLDIPTEDFYNYALCFFTYFAYRAIGGV